jgi:hypothetical protein
MSVMVTFYYIRRKICFLLSKVMKVYLLMTTIFGTKQKNKQSSKNEISYKTFLCHED